MRAVFALFAQARKHWTFRRQMVELPLASVRQQAVASALALATQKRRATELLYESDCPAEALLAARGVLQAATAVVEAAAEGEPPAASRAVQLQTTLDAWGVRPAVVRSICELDADLRSTPLPALDEGVQAHDLERLERLLRACRAVESAFAGVTRTRRQRVGWRVASLAIPLALATLVFVGLWLTSLEVLPSASAHGTWSQRVSEMGPHFVLDRDPKTEWVAPDASTGWLELRFVRRRDVRAVMLRNGSNRGILDRATRGYRVELYRGERLLASAAGTFAAIELAPLPAVLELAAKRVDRVRIVIDSFHGFGPALAEVEIQ